MWHECCDLFVEDKPQKKYRFFVWHKLVTIEGEEIYCQNSYTSDKNLPVDKLSGYVLADVVRKYYKRGIYIAGIKSITKEEFEAAEVDWTKEVEWL